MSPLLTIGITSYNRLEELSRCIESIQTKYVNEIEILVSEDRSPQTYEIENRVKELAERSVYSIIFSRNDINLGYDMNLGAIIQKAKGKFVFFLSDDDAMNSDCLDEIIDYLRTDEKNGVFYSPFVYSESGLKDRNRSDTNFVIAPGENSASRYVYDSILFSGLIFRKKFIEEFDSQRFVNHNYFQVYLFLEMLLKHGGYYFSTPSIRCIGDGENAYGLSESSRTDSTLASKERNEMLSNRKSVKSNLEFNKTLIKVIQIFDEDEDTCVMQSFAKQYSIHSISGLTLARKEGMQYFTEYWEMLKNLDIRLYPISRVYYVMLYILGARFTTFLLSGLKKKVKKER